MVPDKKEKTMSVLDQLKKLDEQRANLLASAKEEALKKVEAGIADLNALGFDYRLVEGGDEPFPLKKKPASGITRQRDPNAPCTTCGFVTNPPHDSRKHRAQGENKKPFTAKELADLGLAKV